MTERGPLELRLPNAGFNYIVILVKSAVPVTFKRPSETEPLVRKTSEDLNPQPIKAVTHQLRENQLWLVPFPKY